VNDDVYTCLGNSVKSIICRNFDSKVGPKAVVACKNLGITGNISRSCPP